LSRSAVLGATLTLLLVSACSSDSSPSSTQTIAASAGSAAEFAASAERALEATVFEDLGTSGIADLVTNLCQGLGVGAIPATIDGLDIDASSADEEIITEVLAVGLSQVCPDRAPIDLAGFYLDAVTTAVQDGSALSALEDGDVIRAGPVVCDALQNGSGVEAALLAVVRDLFAVEANSVDGLSGLMDAEQGLVAGAVLAAATAFLCPEHAGAVEAFMASL